MSLGKMSLDEKAFGQALTQSAKAMAEEEDEHATTTLSLSQINGQKLESIMSQASRPLLASTQRQAFKECQKSMQQHTGDRFIPCRQGSDKYEMQY
jgi:hypothetical protein